MSNTFMTSWQNNDSKGSSNSYKYVVEPLPIAVEQRDQQDEKENAYTQ